MGKVESGQSFEGVVQVEHLYVHFPFCRRKCTYCALHSRAGTPANVRTAYVKNLTASLASFPLAPKLRTIYFGGGSPALCDLTPLLAALEKYLAPSTEFTVELHPLDVTPNLLKTLSAQGVNRISMGVQSLDDDILSAMGRGYTFSFAERAFSLIREHFENAGIDLIVGYPGETAALLPRHARLANWGLSHCSVYSLILEPKSILAHLLDRGKIAAPPDDDTTLNRLSVLAKFLQELGFHRYEISNFAIPGREAQHNLAVWRGENYLGLGEGAHGRIGRMRTRNLATPLAEFEIVSDDFDQKERTLFRLRTMDGLDASHHPEWTPSLTKAVENGHLRKNGMCYFLTERGTEICDAIIEDLL